MDELNKTKKIDELMEKELSDLTLKEMNELYEYLEDFMRKAPKIHDKMYSVSLITNRKESLANFSRIVINNYEKLEKIKRVLGINEKTKRYEELSDEDKKRIMHYLEAEKEPKPRSFDAKLAIATIDKKSYLFNIINRTPDKDELLKTIRKDLGILSEKGESYKVEERSLVAYKSFFGKLKRFGERIKRVVRSAVDNLEREDEQNEEELLRKKDLEIREQFVELCRSTVRSFEGSREKEESNSMEKNETERNGSINQSKSNSKYNKLASYIIPQNEQNKMLKGKIKSKQQDEFKSKSSNQHEHTEI